ncbi:mini-chromosome maintenance replisome factor-domain-containing protein [Rhodocollybia butyracea]|uniref:Mini-chromosome maintenance replisome factor-domain-containing protein n=1 Tax=Rhodocollybia butyracea TaxID=206335 RepID=A0A9P5Q3Q9_9AGAR|nr:mini-chromosome maintenance replisome factor-domain-containing protein [Rhodocollybia butyracea]
MVSSVPFDVLEAPEVEIQEIFNQHVQSQLAEEFSTVLSHHFREIFEKDEHLDLIPYLDSTYFSDTKTPSSLKLVQFCGMVQDTSASPELYLSRLKDGKFGGWGSHETMDGHVDYSDLRECTRFWVVSVPGQSQWARNDDKAQKSRPNAYKFPLPSTPHIGIHASIYSNQADSELKSTDVARFIGLYESERETLHVLFHLREDIVQKPYQIYPLSLVDTKPESSDKKEDLDDIKILRNELISWIADESLAGDKDAAEWVLLSIISRVQSRSPPIMPTSLTISCFPPPTTRADSSSTSSTASEGPFTSSEHTPTLYHVLSFIFPIITHIPLSLPLLNDGVFVPESKPRPLSDDTDEDPEDELYSGILQLAPSTLCVITDSGITEGRINDRGVRNLRALQEVIRNQTLEYVFPYSGFRFETDTGCIVCTEGKKSALVETHVVVPLKPSSSSLPSELPQRLYKPSTEINLPPAEKLTAWRKLIGGAMAKQTKAAPSSSTPSPVGGIGVSDAAAEFIQEEFVKERQEGAKEREQTETGVITPDDLIHRMLMAKLLALSMHQLELSLEVWCQMKDLERRRLSRVT